MRACVRVRERERVDACLTSKVKSAKLDKQTHMSQFRRKLTPKRPFKAKLTQQSAQKSINEG